MLATAAAVLLSLAAIAEPPPDAEIVAAADRLGAEAVAGPGGAALSIAVSRHGTLIHSKGYGLAEVEHGVKADEHTLFRIGSITKQFTAAAVMRLVEQGKLGLDDPVRKHLPEYNTQGREITVRHLLTHTSGIKPYTEITAVMEHEAGRRFSHAELLALFQDEPLAFEPGTKHAYNNSGYYLLGLIIEKVSGQAYCEFMQEQFFGPLGLAHTRCDSNTDIIRGRAQGYAVTGGQRVNDAPLAPTTPFAAGMLLASARDLVRWSDALAAGRVVSAGSYEQMTTPHTLADGSATKYGLGLAVDTVQGHARVRHGGGISGFNSMLVRWPEHGVTIAVLSSSEAIPSGQIAGAISQVALGIGAPPAGRPAPAEGKPAGEGAARPSPSSP